MLTFLMGLLILCLGYVFYSKYVVRQVEPSETPTPAHTLCDNIDYIPMGIKRNSLIHLLNIAGIGPLMGAVQGILFGPVAFLIIPIGCVFMGAVHDYMAGMISVRNEGEQITSLIKKYLGNSLYWLFVLVSSVVLILVAVVFVYTSGDILAEKMFNVTDFSLNNPVIITIYAVIIGYYVLASLFPIDKIIGKVYPIFGVLLIVGTLLILGGFLTNGVTLQNIDFKNINVHPAHLAIIPMFFVTVSCGMLSGFHSTQATIISRTLNNEKDGKIVFYGMMCVECLIAMIWAAGAMHVYSNNLVPADFVGKANVINVITDTFLPHYLTFLVTAAIIVLPITSGDTALRGLRLVVAEILGWKKCTYKHCLQIIIPILFILVGVLAFAKTNNEAFFLVWRYFTFANSSIASIVFLFSTIYLYQRGKNYLITLLPGIVSLFVCFCFILNAKIGFNLSLTNSKIGAAILCLLAVMWLRAGMKKLN